MKNSRRNPLDNLGYFTEWGGKSWEKLVLQAFDQLLGYDLTGQHILEVGSRSGKMSCLFALLGGKVTGIDIDPKCILIGQAEAHKWNIENAEFLSYDGDLDMFQDGTFDVIFTKSVLVVIPQLEDFLLKLSSKLRSGGKVAFFENAYGSSLLNALRYFKHRGKWDYRKTAFFGEKEVSMMKKIFDIRIIGEKRVPPIYLIGGYKRTG